MNESQLLDLAAQAVEVARAAGATAADAMAVLDTDVSAGIRHGKPETIERAESRGVGLRVFVGQGSATLSTSDVTQAAFRDMAERAVAIARVAPADPFAGLAAPEHLAAHVSVLDIADQAALSMEQLQAMARAAEARGLEIAGITNSGGADAGYSEYRMALATSHGFSGHYRTTRYSLSASLIAGEGPTMQRDYDYAMATHLTDLPDAETVGLAAAMRCTEKLNPRKLRSQTAVVYFEPRVGRGLISAFISAISGSAIARGTSFLKDALHTPVFAPNITITDDPARARGLGSRPFDAEGVAGSAMDFIHHGQLTSWMLDTRSANQLGLTTTGHASRGLASAPHPSSSNLYLHGGKKSPCDVFAKLGDGFFVTETIGHGVNLITGDFSVGASGFWMENGARAYPVSEVTIAGNLREMFKTLVAADDLEFRYGINVPTLAIPQMTIAGE